MLLEELDLKPMKRWIATYYDIKTKQEHKVKVMARSTMEAKRYVEHGDTDAPAGCLVTELTDVDTGKTIPMSPMLLKQAF